MFAELCYDNCSSEQSSLIIATVVPVTVVFLVVAVIVVAVISLFCIKRLRKRNVNLRCV